MHKNIMTKKQIEKMFNNMKESCETVKSLYDKNFYDIVQAMEQIDNYRNYYMSCLNGLLLFDMINGKLFDYAYDLLKDFEIKFF